MHRSSLIGLKFMMAFEGSGMSRGQHLLANSQIVDSIVRKSKLLQAAHKIVVVAVDKRMVEIFQGQVAEQGYQERLIVRETVVCSPRGLSEI
ncbi:hypothetical protein Nepgr_008347 [Nepenthes gracilis]|uniref:Uncharacterized protein n=1 Tax=Nepenthes gracilis TaxID=150966 RepID=A0AAD3XJ52_NEPGR|nr:hypothetical protein Nepgr_008347 [Nepenthes gracilis]